MEVGGEEHPDVSHFSFVGQACATTIAGGYIQAENIKTCRKRSSGITHGTDPGWPSNEQRERGETKVQVQPLA